MSGTGGGGGIIIHSQTKSGPHMRRRTVLTADDIAAWIASLADGPLKSKLQELLDDLP